MPQKFLRTFRATSVLSDSLLNCFAPPPEARLKLSSEVTLGSPVSADATPAAAFTSPVAASLAAAVSALQTLLVSPEMVD